MSKRKSLITLIGFILFSLACFYFAIAFTLPSLAEKQVLRTLESFGFEDVSFARSVQKDGNVIIKNVRLDKDSFSKIDSVILEYNTLDLLLKKRLKTVTLRDMDLTAEMDVQGNLSIAGWNPLDFPDIHADNIIVENGSIDILWLGVGGVNLRYDLRFIESDDGSNILGTLDGKQKQVSFESTVTGHANHDGSWSATLDIRNGKVDVSAIQASRITGQAELFGIGYSAPDLLVQLSSGNVTLFGLPWQNVSATIEGLPGAATSLIEGKSSSKVENNEDLVEFSATVRTRDQEHKMGISMYGATQETMTDFMKEHGLLVSTETKDGANQMQLSNGWELKFSGKSYLIFNGNDIMGRIAFETP